MIFNIIQLTFHTPLHLSRGKENTYESSATVLHSDKLKSALYVAALQLFDKEVADDILQNVRVSSAFPFDENGYWLPRPLSFQPEVSNPRKRKEYKNIKYLTTTQFSQMAKGEEVQNLLDIPQPDIWQREVTQRVKINCEGDSEPFYLEKLYAKKDAGLYFFVQRENEIIDENKFIATLNLLGDNGIGLQRALGNGQFKATKNTLDIDLPEKAASWMSLSLYRPNSENEVKSILGNSFYQFIKRGGWISSPEKEEHLRWRKKSIMMFTEGSVFAFSEEMASFLVKGQIVDLKPDEMDTHPIWRDGKAMFLPLS